MISAQPKFEPSARLSSLDRVLAIGIDAVILVRVRSAVSVDHAREARNFRPVRRADRPLEDGSAATAACADLMCLIEAFQFD